MSQHDNEDGVSYQNPPPQDETSTHPDSSSDNDETYDESTPLVTTQQHPPPFNLYSYPSPNSTEEPVHHSFHRANSRSPITRSQSYGSNAVVYTWALQPGASTEPVPRTQSGLMAQRRSWASLEVANDEENETSYQPSYTRRLISRSSSNLLRLSTASLDSLMHATQIKKKDGGKKWKDEDEDDDEEESGGKWSPMFLIMMAATLFVLTSPSTWKSVLNNKTHSGEGPVTDDYIQDDDNVVPYDGRKIPPLPLSEKSPVSDLDLDVVYTRKVSPPGMVFQSVSDAKSKESDSNIRRNTLTTHSPSARQSLPTNSWYQNLLLLPDDFPQPTQDHRAYSVPYVVDSAGLIAGLRLIPGSVMGSEHSVDLITIGRHSVTMGLLGEGGEEVMDRRYVVDDETLTSLAITLNWKGKNKHSTKPIPRLSSTIVKGMAYGTMHYHNLLSTKHYPTISSETGFRTLPLADGTTTFSCNADPIEVKRDVILNFQESDMMWVMFVSRPVKVKCVSFGADVGGVIGRDGVRIQVTEVLDPQDTVSNSEVDVPDLTVRLAIASHCVMGQNPVHCEHGKKSADGGNPGYIELLRQYSQVYPGPNADVEFAFAHSDDDVSTLRFGGAGERKYQPHVSSKTRFIEEKDEIPDVAYLRFDWDARTIGNPVRKSLDEQPNIMAFALPHHIDELVLPESSPPPSRNDKISQYCQMTLYGNVCPIHNLTSSWLVREDLGQKDGPSFLGPRPPTSDVIPALADSLNEDLEYKILPWFLMGSADTYFPGKVLARLARVLMVYEGVKTLKHDQTYDKAAFNGVNLPPQSKFDSALSQLRSGVEIWLNGTAGAPFLYDAVWGGLINCGCSFQWEPLGCANKFPNCPGVDDPGMNFGYGFYNDHHFHLGYHIHAAAVVSHFDPEWGIKFYEKVMLYVRDIANPSPDDVFFPTFRHKDWFQGSSWASGVFGTPLNGRNQESSSESASSYESVALYGKVMMEVWKNAMSKHPLAHKYYKDSLRTRDVGRLLTSTELRSAERYYHVRDATTTSSEVVEFNPPRVHPPEYKEHVVGVMWTTNVQFQTWFGVAPFFAYGIQLLPLTAASEYRGSIEWLKEMYPTFAKECEADDICTKEGWSILQLATLATIGHREEALNLVKALPRDVFLSQGGLGHSLSNTLWYVATRPDLV